MTTLTLYKDTELNNKYQDVFKTKALLESYLSDKVSATISGEFYFKMTGSFNLPVSGYSDVPNYMKAVDSLSGNTTYYFINSYENYNGIFKISYIIDVWHTYVDDMKVTHGRRNLSSYPIGGKGEIVGDILTDGNINCDTSYSEGYALIGLGYGYSGQKSTSELPSTVKQFCIYEDVFTSGAFSYEDVAYLAGETFTKFAETTATDNNTTIYFSITNLWIIPSRFLYYTGCTEDTINLDGKIFDNSEPIYSTPINFIDYNIYAYFPGVVFNGCQLNVAAPPIPAKKMRDKNAEYLKVYDGGKSPIVTKTDGMHDLILSFGQGAYGIDRGKYIYASDVDTGVYIDANITYNSVSIIMSYVNDFKEIAPGMEVGINFSPESRQTSEQRRNNAIQSIVNTAAGTVNSGMNAATNAVQGNIPGAVSSIIGAGVSIFNTAFSLSRETNSTVTSAQGYMEPFPAFVGAGYVYEHIVNYDTVLYNYRSYGLIVDAYETDTAASTRWMDDSDVGDYRVICYSDLKITGPIPEQYKEALEYILKAGCRIWNKNDGTLDIMDSKVTCPDAIA